MRIPPMASGTYEEESTMHTRHTRAIPVAILVVLVALAWPALAGQPEAHNFVTHLSGDEEVPPVDTRAQGQAIFHLSKDGTSFAYMLIVANIENVTQAHIHCGAEGVNGPIVVFLFPFTPTGVTANGVLSEGTITNADVIPR